MQEQIRHYQNKLAFEIDSWDVHAAQNAGERLIVLDVRPQAAFEAERIAGAISFPHRQMLAENVVAFDRDAQYVTYCDGIGCNASTAGALKLAQLGFKVKELIGGIGWWREHGYPLARGALATPLATSGAVALQAGATPTDALVPHCACD